MYPYVLRFKLQKFIGDNVRKMRCFNPPMGAWGLTEHKEEDVVGKQSVA